MSLDAKRPGIRSARNRGHASLAEIFWERRLSHRRQILAVHDLRDDADLFVSRSIGFSVPVELTKLILRAPRDRPEPLPTA